MGYSSRFLNKKIASCDLFKIYNYSFSYSLSCMKKAADVGGKQTSARKQLSTSVSLHLGMKTIVPGKQFALWVIICSCQNIWCLEDICKIHIHMFHKDST